MGLWDESSRDCEMSHGGQAAKRKTVVLCTVHETPDKHVP
jgi:hypothetical protein